MKETDPVSEILCLKNWRWWTALKIIVMFLRSYLWVLFWVDSKLACPKRQIPCQSEIFIERSRHTTQNLYPKQICLPQIIFLNVMKLLAVIWATAVSLLSAIFSVIYIGHVNLLWWSHHKINATSTRQHVLYKGHKIQYSRGIHNCVLSLLGWMQTQVKGLDIPPIRPTHKPLLYSSAV
jgi:hypothetical protein